MALREFSMRFLNFFADPEPVWEYFRQLLDNLHRLKQGPSTETNCAIVLGKQCYQPSFQIIETSEINMGAAVRKDKTRIYLIG